MHRHRSRGAVAGGLALFASLAVIGGTLAVAANVRLTNDVAGGYVSAYTLATGVPYSDSVLDECKIARGRQNEPAVAVDPRDSSVLVGSSNDYCGVYQPAGATVQSPTGPIWLGYYRSENGGTSFQSSLVPGYPGDKSPYAALAAIRTASSGDPVLAWDGEGRLFVGAEASDDPAGSAKTFGDVWVAVFGNKDGKTGATANDGKTFMGSAIVAKGSSAPNLLGKFNDKTSIEADHTGSVCDGTVYFAWSRFTGNAGDVSIYLSRSTDHGRTWSKPLNLTPNLHDVQFPDIAVTGNGHVYVTLRQFESQGNQPDAIDVVRSTDCGATFSRPAQITKFTRYDAQDVATPRPIPAGSAIDDPLGEGDASAAGSIARDCGDFSTACESGYTFFRRDTQVRSTADQGDSAHEWIYLVYDPSKPGTEVATGTTYGSIAPGTGSQSGIYFIRYDGAIGKSSQPLLIDAEATGHQLFPDISADGGKLHAIWWDSRNDASYSPARPVGNSATGVVGPSLDVYASSSSDMGATWAGPTRLTDVTSNPNFEQYSNRAIPFAGDYLWVTSKGASAYAVWTDWRNTEAGPDPREATVDDHDGADVKQCRQYSSSLGWSGDLCPHDGGLDSDIYGAPAP